jgi:hypothetical protein
MYRLWRKKLRSVVKKLLVTASATGALLAGGAGIAGAAAVPSLPQVPNLPDLTNSCLVAQLQVGVSDPAGSLTAAIQNPAAALQATLQCLQSMAPAGLPGLPAASALPQLPSLSGLPVPGIGS